MPGSKIRPATDVETVAEELKDFINGGANTCPPGSFVAGWWKMGNSAFCRGDARYVRTVNGTRYCVPSLLPSRNVATAAATQALISAGADGARPCASSPAMMKLSIGVSGQSACWTCGGLTATHCAIGPCIGGPGLPTS